MEGAICCLCSRAERDHNDQRQQTSPWKARFVAFAPRPQEATMIKGSKLAHGRPNLLPLPLSRESTMIKGSRCAFQTGFLLLPGKSLSKSKSRRNCAGHYLLTVLSFLI